MKKPINILFFVVFIFSWCQAQNNWVGLNRNYILDINKPFSKEAQQFIKEGKDVSSKTSSSQNLLITVIKTPKFNWSTGLSYKVIDFKVKDRIKEWNYIETFDNGQIIDTFHYTFKDPADFVAKSKNYGFMNQFSYSFFSNEKIKNYVGLDLEFYFLEYYESQYESDDYNPVNTGFILKEEDRPYPNNPPLKHFFLSSTSASLFYKFLYAPTNYFSIGTKILFGMNIQSDWSEFQKYSWLGFGVEIGIGKRNEFKMKSNEK
ncbi:MAG: hypothetical protein ACO1O6_13150 [Bacteroidota bacterium]